MSLRALRPCKDGLSRLCPAQHGHMALRGSDQASVCSHKSPTTRPSQVHRFRHLWGRIIRTAARTVEQQLRRPLAQGPFPINTRIRTMGRGQVWRVYQREAEEGWIQLWMPIEQPMEQDLQPHRLRPTFYTTGSLLIAPVTDLSWPGRAQWANPLLRDQPQGPSTSIAHQHPLFIRKKHTNAP